MENRIAKFWNTQPGIEKTLFPYKSRLPIAEEAKYNEEDLIYSFVAGLTVGEELKKDYLKILFKNNLTCAQNKYEEFVKILKDKEGITTDIIFLKAEEINIFHAIYVLRKEDILNKARNIYSHFSFFKGNSNGIILRASLVPNANIDTQRLISDGFFWKYKHEV